LSEYDNEETEIYIPTDEEFWEAYPKAQGVDRADILLQLAMSYCPERKGQPAITMAEMAIEIYKEVGYTEEEIPDFAFCYAVLAEHRSKIMDFPGAIDATVRALELIKLHKLNHYEYLEWYLLKLYVLTGRDAEARCLLDKLLADYLDIALWFS
jgi:hypothetical protein